ncbi:MAG: KEOPS complex subunit Pcc1 [Candidatus Hodarchaeales archaeon]|jgi:tRNA threonylcarbamoyladenosine modification (KEOPS) complex  Pcc1 subunit
MPKISLKLEFDLKNEKLARKIVEALKPEVTTTTEKFTRSTIIINNKDKLININIEAKDIVAAKASFNSIINWFNSTLQILDKFGEFGEFKDL